MRKLFIFSSIALACIFISQVFAEEFTMSTYYPAPFGVYRYFTTTSRTSLATNSLATDGNAMVGIGTIDPTDKLTVSAAWDPSDLISLEDNTATERLVLGVSDAGDYGFITSGRGEEANPDLVIDNNGNVGIGTTDPNATLQVNGTMQIFGAWESRNIATVYQSASDGFVIGYTECAWQNDWIRGFTDGNDPPITKRIEDLSETKGVTSHASITMPVRRNDYWQVTAGACGSPGQYALYWIPFGN